MPRLCLPAAGITALGLLVAPMSAQAAVHPHPSGSTDRVTPGAVRIEARSVVSITLYDDRGVLKQTKKEYEVPIADGAGFTVTPDGVVVTATGVVQPEQDPRIYAANRIFAEYFKVKIPADFEQHSLDDPDLNARLKACYPPQGQNSTCNATVTTKVTVFPYADPPPADGFPAEVLHSGTSSAAPAVLRLTKGGEDKTLPTVPLAATTGAKIESVDLMTVPGRPSGKQPPKVETAHFDPPGSRTFKQSESAKIEKALANGGQGAAIIDDAKSEVIGVISGGGDEPVSVAMAEDIQTALVAANVTARRGPVDLVYETALASYHNKYYGRAVPVLEQVLRLRPDHAVARQYLKISTTNRGTAADAGRAASPAASSPAAASLSPLVWIGAGVVLLGLLAAVAVPLLLRRRRRSAAADGPQPVPVPPPSPVPADSWPPQQTAVIERPRSNALWPAEAARAPEVIRISEGSGAAGAPEPPRPPEASPPSGTPRPLEPIAGDRSGPPVGKQVNFCTQCGMRLGAAHRFCGYCGHPVE